MGPGDRATDVSGGGVGPSLGIPGTEKKHRLGGDSVPRLADRDTGHCVCDMCVAQVNFTLECELILTYKMPAVWTLSIVAAVVTTQSGSCPL